MSHYCRNRCFKIWFERNLRIKQARNIANSFQIYRSSRMLSLSFSELFNQCKLRKERRQRLESIAKVVKRRRERRMRIEGLAVLARGARMQ